MSFLNNNTEGTGDYLGDIYGGETPASGLSGASTAEGDIPMDELSDGGAEGGILGGLASSSPSVGGVNTNKYQDEIARADAHMQQVIAGLIARQQQPSRAEQMAMWSGSGGGTFGEMMGKGLANTAKLTAIRENNLDNLRLKAAQLEQQSIRNKMLDEGRQQAQMYGLAKYGLTLDENGRLVVDPVLAENAAKIKQAGAAHFGVDSVLTPDEKTKLGFSPKDIVKNTNAGPVLVKKSGDELSVTEKAKMRKITNFSQSVLPRLNAVIDSLENGKGSTATGVSGAVVGALNSITDQVGLGQVAPEDAAHRQMVGTLAQDLVRATERGSERLSDADAAAIAPYIPDNTMWAGDEGQLTKAKELRRIIQEKAKIAAEALGEDYVEDMNSLNTQVAPRPSPDEKTNLQTGNNKYPLKMRKYNPKTGKNSVVDVYDDEEFNIMSKKGFQ